MTAHDTRRGSLERKSKTVRGRKNWKIERVGGRKRKEREETR